MKVLLAHGEIPAETAFSGYRNNGDFVVSWDGYFAWEVES
jgi:hypothetical protein